MSVTLASPLASNEWRIIRTAWESERVWPNSRQAAQIFEVKGREQIFLQWDYGKSRLMYEKEVAFQRMLHYQSISFKKFWHNVKDVRES
jgi:hypothetical protein